MDIFSNILQKKAESQNLQYHWKAKETKTLSLAFADDILILAKGEVHSAKVVKECLDEFAKLSGMNYSPLKCKIYMSAVSESEMLEIKEILGYERGSPF